MFAIVIEEACSPSSVAAMLEWTTSHSEYCVQSHLLPALVTKFDGHQTKYIFVRMIVLIFTSSFTYNPVQNTRILYPASKLERVETFKNKYLI